MLQTPIELDPLFGEPRCGEKAHRMDLKEMGLIRATNLLPSEKLLLINLRQAQWSLSEKLIPDITSALHGYAMVTDDPRAVVGTIRDLKQRGILTDCLQIRWARIVDHLKGNL